MCVSQRTQCDPGGDTIYTVLYSYYYEFINFMRLLKSIMARVRARTADLRSTAHGAPAHGSQHGTGRQHRVVRERDTRSKRTRVSRVPPPSIVDA